VYAGSGNDSIDVHGTGMIVAGSGNDSITENTNGNISVGGGSDTVTLLGTGSISENGSGGHDTINLGFGSDTIYEHGQATVYGEFGTASIVGGSLAILNSGSDYHELIASTGNATLIGGEYTNQFVAGSGNVDMVGSGKLGPDTFVGGSGHDTMTGGANTNLFEFLQSEKGGHTVITNFVSGQDQLYLEGHSFSWLEQNHDISSSGGNTTITLDGGQTTIELKGVSSLHSSDITTHK
jgi:hypothetical protein